MDFESRISSKERDRILDLLRSELRKNKLDLANKLLEPAIAYDVYKVLIGDSSDGSKVVRRKLPPDWELWEAAGKSFVAAQQVPAYIYLSPFFSSAQKKILAAAEHASSRISLASSLI